MKKKARRRLERKQTVLQARRDPTARRNVADAARAKGSIRRKTAAMAAPAYQRRALNAKARAERSPNPDNVAALVGAIPADLVAARRAARRHEKRGFSRWTLPFVVLQKFGPAMLKMHRLLPSGDTVTSAEVVAAAAGVHAHYLEAKDTVYRSWTYLYFPVTRACFAPQAVGQYPPTCERHKQWRREYAARVAAVERNSPLRDLLDALGPRTTRETWSSFVGSFSSVWLGCRESLKAADDDYNYVLEWLIRALGYALEAGCAFASLDPDPLPRGTDAKAREKHFKFKVKGPPRVAPPAPRRAARVPDALGELRPSRAPSVLVKSLTKHPDARGR
ncbi:hypothetical protein JL720_15298 [Aureococcus anophagefferens]|nr:hypothetical protein JL720_15298 [Aureococcus anophagefferens]